METMSALDASFLHVEDAVSHMHIGSVGIFEGPAPEARGRPARRSRRSCTSSRATASACGSRRSRSPARSGWTTPTSTSITTCAAPRCPAPGGDEELRNLVGRVMAQKLDRSKPLWEMWLAEGLGGERWALVSKLHHCMVDGVSGTDLLSVVFDDAPAVAARRDPAVGAGPGARCAADSRARRWPNGRRPRTTARAACWGRRARRPARAGGRRARRHEPAHAAAPAGGHVAQRADRAAPPLGLGARDASPTSRRSGPSTAAPSTTSCWP